MTLAPAWSWPAAAWLCAACLMLAGPALAADASRVSKPATLPDSAAREQYDPVQAYPDWRPSALKSASYSELRDLRSQTWGCIECSDDGTAYISVCYYSELVDSAWLVKSLAIAANCQTYATFPLPARDPAGIVRLVLWNNKPTEAMLTPLLGEPLPEQAGPAGLLAEQWFTRQTATSSILPWIDPLWEAPSRPSGIYSATWPLVQAYARQDQHVLCKDCTVRYKGLLGFGLDTDGPYGYWQLSWGAPLTLEFDYTTGYTASQAILVARGNADGTRPWGGSPLLEVIVNNSRVEVQMQEAVTPLGMQPFRANLSPWLKQGSNLVELRLQPLSNTQYCLRGIELWTE